jgi:hypothetical protein
VNAFEAKAVRRLLPTLASITSRSGSSRTGDNQKVFQVVRQ